MRRISWNVFGLGLTIKKDFMNMLNKENSDEIHLQNTNRQTAISNNTKRCIEYIIVSNPLATDNIDCKLLNAVPSSDHYSVALAINRYQ